jgi:hypothetical protein
MEYYQRASDDGGILVGLTHHESMGNLIFRFYAMCAAFYFEECFEPCANSLLTEPAFDNGHDCINWLQFVHVLVYNCLLKYTLCFDNAQFVW